MASGGWLKGIVKACQSGDRLTLMGVVKGGPPPEREITLSSLIAPRLGRRDGSTKDEPFAWEAREFLRKKVIGMPCVFRIDYRVESISRDFGTVYFGSDNTNVNLMMVQAGLAKVRPAGAGGASPQIDDLLQAQEMAEQEGLGMWTKVSGASEASIRQIPPPSSFDAMALLESVGKGKPLPALVEQCNSGSNLKVMLLSDYSTVGVMLAGIQCPSMPRRAPPPDKPAAAAAAPADGGAANGVDAEGVPLQAAPGSAAARLAAGAGAGAGAGGPAQAMPFAREATHFTEIRVLHREVRVVLEGVDKYQNLFGSVYYPEAGQPVDLAEQLLKLGLAKVVDWSAAMMMATSAQKLRNAEREAKQARLRLWKDYVPAPTNSTAITGDEFLGEVVEVVSGDVLMVRGPDGAERRVSVSSIRAPRLGNARREQKAEPYALEAKEFLRQRLVGHKVSVHMEYSRRIPGPGGGGADGAAAGGAADRLVPFGSVYLEEKSGDGGAPVKKNIAEMLVLRGLVGVIRHRGDEERSLHYEALLAAEEKAKKGKKGMHSAREPPVHHVNDVSQGGAGAKAKQFLPFLQRNGRNPGMCEYVLSGHRFKLHVPRESVTVAFALSGVRAPQRDEPFSAEALALMRSLVLQRDCEMEVETVDKGGTFIGSLWVGAGRANVAVKLLEAGLGKLHSSFDPHFVADGRALEQAQEAAKAKRVAMWASYDPEAEAAAAAAAAEDAGEGAGEAEVMEVTVTEVLGGGECYLQRVAPEVESLAEQLSGLSVDGPPPDGIRAGQMCLGLFSGDDSWYRARVERTAPEGGSYDLFYVDFGNRETLPASRVRPMEAEVASMPPQAALCRLAYLHVPPLDEEFGMEAAHAMADLAAGRRMMARVESREQGSGKGQPTVLHVTLSEPGSTTSVNASMLQQGYARIKGRRRVRGKAATAVKALEEHQEVAQSARLNMWQFGDCESDDEDGRPPAWGGRR